MPHHWYPENYDMFQAPDNPNLLATSGSTGQPLSSGAHQGANVPSSFQSLPRNTASARVLVNGLGSGSTSRPLMAQAQVQTVNYQKASSAISAKMGSERKAVHPSMAASAYPPSSISHEVGSVTRSFYNMNPGPTPQSTRADSIRGPSSVRGSTSTGTREPSLFEQPQWEGGSDFIDGSTYFKIDEYVFIRRWHATKKVYSPWLRGKVVRPDFRKTPDGQKEERIYVVSYWDSGVQKERTYSPALKEICEIKDNPGMSTVVSADTNTQPSKTTVKNSTVFALLQVTNGSKPYSIWTPSAIENPQGYRVRAIAGPLKNQEFSKVPQVKPYNAEIAKNLRDSGYRVEKSGIDG